MSMLKRIWRRIRWHLWERRMRRTKTKHATDAIVSQLQNRQPIVMLVATGPDSLADCISIVRRVADAAEEVAGERPIVDLGIQPNGDVTADISFPEHGDAAQ